MKSVYLEVCRWVVVVVVGWVAAVDPVGDGAVHVGAVGVTTRWWGGVVVVEFGAPVVGAAFESSGDLVGDPTL